MVSSCIILTSATYAVSMLAMHISCLNVNTYSGTLALVKVEYHANGKYENPLNISEKITCVGQC